MSEADIVYLEVQFSDRVEHEDYGPEDQHIGELGLRLIHENADLKEEIVALKRGKMTMSHVEELTIESIREYLNDSSAWEAQDATINGNTFWKHERVGRITGLTEEDEAPLWHIQNCISRIAEAEKRGELAVWSDVRKHIKER